MHASHNNQNGWLAQCEQSLWFLWLAVVVGVWIVPSLAYQPDKKQFGAGVAFEQHVAVRVEQIRAHWMATRDTWSVDDVVRARNVLVDMRLLLPEDSAFGKKTEALSMDIIHYAQDQPGQTANRNAHYAHRRLIGEALAASMPSMMDPAEEVENRAQLACMDLRGAPIGYSACAMEQGRLRQEQESLSGLLGVCGSIFLWLFNRYLLAIPFLAAAFWFKVRREGQGYVTVDEYAKAFFGDFVLAALCPLSLACDVADWCPWTAFATRVRERLSGVSVEMPAWQYAAACVVIVCGTALSCFFPTRAVRAAEPAAIVSVKGYVDAEAATDGTMKVGHGWLDVKVPVGAHASGQIVVDSVSTKVPVRQAVASVQPVGGPITVNAGQVVTPFAHQFPGPQQERIGGGAEAPGRVATFLDLGIHAVANPLRGVAASIALLSGSGPNRPDANEAKDAMAGLSLSSNDGASNLGIVAQAGEQPNGFRTRGVVHASTRALGGGVLLDATAAFQRIGIALSWGTSALVVVPVHKNLEFAGAYDYAHAAGSSDEQIARLQVTGIGFSSAMRGAIMARWSSATGWLGSVRMQFAF